MAGMVTVGRFFTFSRVLLLKDYHVYRSFCAPAVASPAAPSSSSSSSSSGRAEKISKAMRAYLERARVYDEFMNKEESEFEIGKRHLANMMGVDPDNFTQDDIDNAIAYLFPSGLYDPRARPLLKPPKQVFPKKKAAEFDRMGRPFHCFFYTGKPNFYQTLHEIALNMKELIDFEDKLTRNGNQIVEAHHQITLYGSQWLNRVEIGKLLLEDIKDDDYDYLTVCLDRLASQPYSDRKKDFIMRFRKQLIAATQAADIPQLMYDESGRPFMEALGRRKRTNARVIVRGNGKGLIEINGNDIAFFDSLQSREQIMFPLLFTNLIGTVDVEATVVGAGFSLQAGAIRLALSLALRSFVSSEMVEKMRLAGLLTWDPRSTERKKPGQAGARRKYTWKKR